MDSSDDSSQNNSFSNQNFEDYYNDEVMSRVFPMKEFENENNDNHSFDRDEKADFKLYEIPVDKSNIINEKDCKCKLNDNNISNNGNKQTKVTSKTLTKKRQRDDGENPNKKQGRKKIDDDEKGDHDKFSEDNMIRKIKSNFIKYAHERINSNISDKDLQLFRLDSELNEILKKDYNLQLMEKTFKYLYENTPISSKYRKKNANINKYLIEKLYNEERFTQTKAISDLDKTYKELYNDYINNNLDKLLNKIKNELEKVGKESEESIADYLEKFKHLCLTYEDWFKNKKGRNGRNKRK
jgi:hypothetical protein